MSKVKCIFLGRHVENSFEVWKSRSGNYKPYIDEKVMTISREPILETEIIISALEEGQEIYLHNLNKRAKVQKITASTDGSFVIDTTYVLSKIVKNTKEDILEEFNKAIELYKNQKEKEIKLKEQQEEDCVKINFSEYNKLQKFIIKLFKINKYA